MSWAGLVPVMALAQRAGLDELVAEHVRPGGPCGVSAPVKAGCLVAGMAAGADCTDDMDLPRHGAMSRLSGGIRAPSTEDRAIKIDDPARGVTTRYFPAGTASRAAIPGADR